MNPAAAAAASSDSHAAALRGASLAFGKKPRAALPSLTPSSSSSSSSSSLSLLAPPPAGHGAESAPRSPSFIAATLAARRSASPTPRPGRFALFERVDHGRGPGSSPHDAQRLAVERFMAAPPRRLPSPPPPTTLPAANPDEKPRRLPPNRLSTPPPPPRRPSPPSPDRQGVAEPQRSKSLSPDATKPRPHGAPLKTRQPSTPEVLFPKPTRLVASTPQMAPSLPSLDPHKRSPGIKQQPPPAPPKPRASQRLVASRQQPARRVRRRRDSDAPRSPPIPSSALPPGRQTPPPRLRGRRHSVAGAPLSLIPDPPPGRLANLSTSSSLQLGSLTDAIMAGSLAASRLTPHNTGSWLPPPSLPMRQRSPRLLQTLRQPRSAEDEEPDRHRKGHVHKLHSGKHAHHEGSRRRWREEMTDRERKRYEAVWASNRGLLLEDGSCRSVASGSGGEGDISECVANVVVRDIWKRSRLPDDELAEVWDLVDRDGRGMLTRPEFVVGMWLLDQRLRGRKVPQRVSDSVWGSAHGVTVKKPRAK